MGKRRDPRIEARLPVRIAGIDVNGRPLLQMVTTRNISRRGALLEGVQGAFKPEETISLTYKNNKGRFRVSWMGNTGTDRAGQMGVQSIDPAKCIWDASTLPPTAADTYAPKAKERRQHRRVPCKLGAELYMQGLEALVRADVRNISEGGCFVEMPTLPPDKARLKIIVWAHDNKLAMQGVVASRRPGFGISIKFTELSEDVRQELQRLVQSLLVRGE
ncbi:MAG: PilZ domain-containing protein [Terriglobales bacterium]